ncbi:MAG: hypothetical protein JJU12_07580 [Chlamydiales bacterium]|nr:hypothetical protein [Chlamydiales bacterium]
MTVTLAPNRSMTPLSDYSYHEMSQAQTCASTYFEAVKDHQNDLQKAGRTALRDKYKYLGNHSANPILSSASSILKESASAIFMVASACLILASQVYLNN